MSGRPRGWRWIGCAPHSNYYKPQGIPMGELESTKLTPAEAEAIRLCDAEGKSQQEAAEAMKISQPTLNRELKEARRKVADALTKGKAIQIDGGENMPSGDGTGPQGEGPMTGRGLGRCAPKTPKKKDAEDAAEATETSESNQETQYPRAWRPGFGFGRGRGQGFGRGRGAGRGRGRGNW